MVCHMDSVCPKLSEEEGRLRRVLYSGYTIKDYLTLGKVSIFAASGKLAPLKKKQEARIRAEINSKRYGFDMLACQTVLF